MFASQPAHSGRFSSRRRTKSKGEISIVGAPTIYVIFAWGLALRINLTSLKVSHRARASSAKEGEVLTRVRNKVGVPERALRALKNRVRNA